MIANLSIRRWCCWVVVGAAVAFQVPPAAAQVGSSPSRLQSLVNDTAAQFQLVYRHDADERQRRQQQLAAAVASWRTAERNEANNRLLAEWLRAAIRSSMPGSDETLPPLPELETLPAGLAAPTSGGESAGDPFRDDPLPAEL